MSERNGTAPKKSVASEAGNDAEAELLKKYADLMREAGSPNGAWNPEPDEHISGVLRHDVELSPNETKAIFGVKAHCIRNNPAKGRTAWGWAATGKPFRATELGNLFGWDPSNTMKHLARPLAYGFIRRDEKTGQLGLGARVQGKYVPPNPKPGTPSEVDLLVCTYQLPRYLAESVCSQLTANRRVAFLDGWKAIKERKQDELNTEKQRIYESEQNELSEHCRTFDPRLPGLKRKRTKPESEEAECSPDSWSVHTSAVQNSEAGLYNGSEQSVPTTHIRKQSKAQFRHEQSSSSVAEADATTTSTNPSQESSDSARSEVSLVTAALAPYCIPEEGKVIELIARCRQHAPDCTGEEIVRVIHEKGKHIRNADMPLAFAVKAVSNCFQGEAYRHVRARKAAAAAGSQASDPAAEFQLPSLEEQIEMVRSSLESKHAWLKEHPANRLDPARTNQRAGALKTIEELQEELRSLERELSGANGREG